MIKKLLAIFFSVGLILNIFQYQVLGQDDEEVGGLAICKLVGGSERITGNFKLTENFAELNDFEAVLGVDIAGENESKKGFRSLESGVEISDVVSDDFEVGKLLMTVASSAELFVEVEEGDRAIAIVSLNQDENGDFLEHEAKLLLTAIKNNTVSGVTQVRFPRTVVLPLDSPSVEAIENAGEGTEVSLQDAIENGSVTLKCRFKNVPLSLIGG